MLLIAISFVKADIPYDPIYIKCLTSGTSSNMYSCKSASDQIRCNDSLQTLKNCLSDDESCIPFYNMKFESYVNCFTGCANSIQDPDLKSQVGKFANCLQGKTFKNQK
ncbi:hypothetical protein ABPG73_005021 [Tetrahymena malaccensis]